MGRALMARALATGLLVGGAAVAVAEGTGALAQVQPGAWLIHEIGAKTPPRPMCVRDPRRLIQLEHGAAACTHKTISADADAATVRYVCPGAGNGLTDLTVESTTVLKLHTQGVIRGAPFDTTYEARFAGPCGGGVAAR